ncbi:hypothetical protein ACSBR1_031396 [Camellia fascicularis]
MEEIQEIAQFYYKAVPKNVRKLAKKFLKKMDDNGDGKVSLTEFTGFMGEGYEAMNNPAFFEEINKNKNGELDFDDVKIFCDTKSFYLHPTCFCRGKYVHKHYDFLDNYALLESIRHKGLPDGDAQKNQVS